MGVQPQQVPQPCKKCEKITWKVLNSRGTTPDWFKEQAHWYLAQVETVIYVCTLPLDTLHAYKRHTPRCTNTSCINTGCMHISCIYVACMILTARLGMLVMATRSTPSAKETQLMPSQVRSLVCQLAPDMLCAVDQEIGFITVPMHADQHPDWFN